VDLTDPGHRKLNQFEMMDLARAKVIPQMPQNLRINIAEVPDFAVGGNMQGVQYIISGPDFGVLEDSSEKILKVLRESGKAVDVDSTNIPGRPEVQVSINRDRASDLGVSVR